MPDQQSEIERHNRRAPYWAAALIVFILTGLATVNIKTGGFWNGYVLDMVGPAWTYILVRGLFTAGKSNRWTRFFTPVKTFFILFLACIAIETAQYFGLYDATFDPWDLIAYAAFLLPAFIIDTQTVKSE